MSPEQALARRIAIDHRTDVFSLGVVLYELLTLRRPFEGKTSQQVLYKISFTDPQPIRRFDRSVPRDLEVICFKAMEKNPDRRYATAGEFAADLRRFLGHESIVARPPSPFELALRRVARHRIVAVAAAVAVVAVLSGMSLQHGRDRHRTLEKVLEPLRELARSTDLESRDPAALHDVIETLAELDESRGELSQDDVALLDALGTRIHAVGERLGERGRSAWQTIVAPGLGGDSGRPQVALVEIERYWQLVQALHDLRTATMLVPTDAALRAESDVERAFPLLSVVTDPPGALVTLSEVRPVDEKLQNPRAIGRAPIVGVAVRPGKYRVTAVLEGVGFAEITRFLDQPGCSYELHPRVLPTDVVERDMVRVPAKNFLFGDPDPRNDVYLQREEHTDEFWIDRCEVSNAQYRAFVEATGHEAPSIWKEKEYGPACESLAVVDISWIDAVAYAEWAGKRLPTQFEWEHAARGEDGRPYPWGDDGTQLGQRARIRGRVDNETFELYRENTVAVDLDTGDIGPYGLLHMFDNVREWVDSVHVVLTDGREVPQLSSPMLMGGALTATEDWTLRKRATTLGLHREYFLGFRCAKSASPR